MLPKIKKYRLEPFISHHLSKWRWILEAIVSCAVVSLEISHFLLVLQWKKTFYLNSLPTGNRVIRREKTTQLNCLKLQNVIPSKVSYLFSSLFMFQTLWFNPTNIPPKYNNKTSHRRTSHCPLPWILSTDKSVSIDEFAPFSSRPKCHHFHTVFGEKYPKKVGAPLWEILDRPLVPTVIPYPRMARFTVLHYAQKRSSREREKTRISVIF